MRTVVNTHHHGDHTFGNCLFGGAAIVAHERAREEAIAFGPPREMPFWDGPDWGDLRLDPPFVTFTDEITLHVGDLRAHVRHVGTAAHTTNDSIVWIPERSVLFCGDLIFNGGTPFLLMGSVAGAVEALETVIPPSARARSCPATARLRPPGPIEGTLDYLRFVLDAAERGGAARPPWRRPGARPRPGRRWPDASGSSATCTAPTPTGRTPRGGPVHILAALAAWSPTTAATR